MNVKKVKHLEGKEPLVLKNNTDTGTNEYKLSLNNSRLKVGMVYNYQSSKVLVALKLQWE